jgi:hypothetical protein
MNVFLKTTLALSLVLPMSAFSMSGLELAKKVDAVEDGDNSTGTTTMILIDKKGNKRVRSMKTFGKDKGKDKLSIVYFLKPNDVKNTAFLTYDYKDSNKDDDQWLYLPALKKTKRIASTDKSGSFMGSDFSYADMTDRNVEDYNYKILKEQTVRGQKVWIMQVVPKTQKTVDEYGYKKSYMFVSQESYMVIQAIHFQTDGKKKFMTVRKMEKIDGVWTALEIEMKTKKGKKTTHATVLKISDMKYNQKLDESFFTVRQIEKGL